MLILFDGVKKLISSKTSANHPPTIDSLLLSSLRAVSYVTAIACILVTARTYIGDNINCVAAVGEEELQAVESYCFISSTFTVANLTLPNQTPHPGLGPAPHREYFPEGTRPAAAVAADGGGTVFHAYYQWVPFVLALQSMVLYLPSVLWNMKENGYLAVVLMGLHKVHVDQGEAEMLSKASVQFFHRTMGSHNKSFAISFLACEVFGFCVALGNLFFTNMFLGGRFFYFGTGAMAYLATSVTDPNNPLNEVFPKVAKCTWHKFGPTGTIQTLDALCVLPLNIVNEKTYIALWIAFIFTVVVAAVVTLTHLIVFLVPKLLDRLICRSSGISTSRDQTINIVLTQCDFGDKFMMWCLSKHMTRAYFPRWTEHLLHEITQQLNGNK